MENHFGSLAAAHRWLRANYGVSSLLSSSAKAHKSRGHGTLTAVLYLAAHRRVGKAGPACPKATAGCISLCLGEHSGHMVRYSVQRAQAARSAAIGDAWNDPTHPVWSVLALEVASLQQKAARQNLIPSVRLNGTSDLAWYSQEAWATLRDTYRDVIWYDYTKRDAQFREAARRAGVDVTLSATEHDTPETIADAVAQGERVAVVFRDALPHLFWYGLPVVDGDAHDARFLDPRGCVVALSAKGVAAKRDRTGFVRDDAADGAAIVPVA